MKFIPENMERAGEGVRQRLHNLLFELFADISIRAKVAFGEKHQTRPDDMSAARFSAYKSVSMKQRFAGISADFCQY